MIEGWAEVDVDRDIVQMDYVAMTQNGDSLSSTIIIGRGPTRTSAIIQCWENVALFEKEQAVLKQGECEEQVQNSRQPAVSSVITDLRYLAAGGWAITIQQESTDDWVVSAKHPKQTMGNVHGVDVEDAVANARAWIEKWEKQENQRIAERKVERT
jgi:predicted RNase H-like HicB family nuclease